MKEAQEISKEDKELLEILVREAKSNDKKIMVYPFEKRLASKKGVSFVKEWHVMKEGNRTSKKFQHKNDAVVFARKMNKSISGKIHVSR